VREQELLRERAREFAARLAKAEII